MQKNVETYEIIKEVISSSNNILIVTHTDPDGDAIGSSLGLYNVLKSLNKRLDVYIEKPGKDFDFLCSYNQIKSNQEEISNIYDTLFVLDCSDKSRVAFNFEQCDFKNIIVFDHHITHIEFGNITLLDTYSPATCQILYDFITYCNFNISKEIAECIYTGLVTDTGCFKYLSVNPHTFEIAKDLLEKGINISYITKRVNDNISINKFNLLKIFLNNIELIDNKIAFAYLSKSDIQNIGNNEDNIHEGLVNYGRDIENVEVSIFIRQVEENEFKISMRANEYVDVSKIAQKLGGGGHIKAAGAKYIGQFNDLKKILLDEINKQIRGE